MRSRRSGTIATKLHRADPRARLTPGQLQNAADLVEAFAAALKPLEALAADQAAAGGFSPTRIVRSSTRCRSERRGDGVAFAGPDGTALDRAFDEIADNAQDAVAVVGVGLSRPVPRHRRRKAGAPARPAGRARAHLRSARSAAAIDRPRRARRAGRGRVAAGDAQRSLAQPSDAPRARPRPAGAAHFALGPRLRADARRRRGRARLSRQARGRADGAVALHPAAGGGRRRERDGRRRCKRGETLSRAGRASSTGPRAKPRPVPRPEPKPARDARPTSLSVTEIETWLRDPYSIYARHILRLQPLDAIDTPPGARDRGTVIHGAIGTFTTQFKDALPADPVGELIKLGEEEFAALEDFPEARRSGGRAILRIARWFADFEARRRANVDRHQRGDRRQARDSARQPHLHAAHARRPHRASARRPLRHPRLQDRPAADRVRRCRPGCRRSSRSKARSCAPDSSRAFRRARRSPNSSMWRCAAASRRAMPRPIEFERQHARRQVGRGAARS